MPLEAGVRLGPYEVGDLLGAGSMGEVYCAHDPRLERDVALKVLPAHYLSDPGRLDRFQREARATATLNHPNVVAIFDTGTSDGVPFIASELLTGTTLREALTPGVPWPPHRAVAVAQSIARGLAAAHAHGIVHRDLKPENIFLTDDGAIKILDFGLARLVERQPLADGASTFVLTEAGTVLGTVGYMAPEQVRGEAADHRADLFALGAILYEMLTGRRAFTGETSVETMTAILTLESPEIGDVAHDVPLALERIVTRCLDKRPAARFQSASDLAFALEASDVKSSSGLDARGAVGPVTTRRRWLLGAAGFAATAVASAKFGGRFFGASGAANHATFVDLALPSGPEVLEAGPPAMSHDGRQLSFAVDERGGSGLWIKSLDAPGYKRVSTPIGSQPFWSPDDRSLGFFDEHRQLKTVDLASGAVESVAEAPRAAVGDAYGTWNSSGDIVVTRQGVFHLHVPDGAFKPLVMRDLTRGDYFLGAPQFLPDGQHYLFTAFCHDPEMKEICVGTLGSNARRSLLRAGSTAWYSEPGYLLFAREGTLFAQRFDANRLTLAGPPARLADGLGTGRWGARIGGSRAGTLCFTTGDPFRFQFTWFDRSGRETNRIADPIEALAFDVAMDGATVVTMRGLPGELWQIDARRGGMSKLTDGADDADPRISRDGKSVLFGGTYDGRRGLDRVSLQGGARTRVFEGPEEPLHLSRLLLHDWSRDGRFALCDVTGFHQEILAVALSDGTRQMAIRTPGADQARFSPDGRWIAYNAMEAGRPEVFIVPFPPTGEHWQISTSGGVQPEWRGDGRELFYLDLSGTLMALDTQLQRGFAAGSPRPLFLTRLVRDSQIEEYRVTADGQRFLLRVPVGGASRTTLLLNWQALLTE